MDYDIKTADQSAAGPLLQRHQDSFSFLHTSTAYSHNIQTCAQNVGLFINNLYSDYNITIWEGIKKGIRELGYNLISYIGGSFNNPVFNNQVKNTVYNPDNLTDISGIIVISTSINAYISRNKVIDFYRTYLRYPIVSIGSSPRNIPNITINNRTGMRSLIMHLVRDHGYRRIAFIRGPVNSEDAEVRYRIYREILLEKGISINENLIVQGSFHSDSGRTAINQLIDERKNGFEALVCSNDFVAASAITELRRRGIRVPEDIAVTGFDNITESKLQEQALTTVNQPTYILGYQAAYAMHSLLNGKRIPMHTEIPSHLITGNSCGCYGEQGQAEHNGNHFLSVYHRINEKSGISAIRNHIALKFEGIPKKQQIADWANRLFTTLVKELTEESENSFLTELKDIILEADDSIFEAFCWNDIIHFIFNDIVPKLSLSSHSGRVNSLLKESLLLIQSISMKNLTSAMAKSNTYERMLNTLKQKLNNVLSIKQLKNIVKNDFPAFGIRSCYISVYTTANNPEDCKSPVPLISYSNCQLIERDDNVSIFNLDKLTHGMIKNPESNTSWFTQALSFNTKLLGFIIYELEESIVPLTDILILNQGSICENLTIEMETAIKNILSSKKRNKNSITEEKETGTGFHSFSLPEQKAEKYLRKIQHFIEKTAVFLDPDLSLFSLAEQMKIPRCYMSYVINRYAKVNFYDFINRYRIEKAKGLISGKTDKPYILAIAYDSGFKTKSTFNKLFRKMTNMTPTEYWKQSLVKLKQQAGKICC